MTQIRIDAVDVRRVALDYAMEYWRIVGGSGALAPKPANVVQTAKTFLKFLEPEPEGGGDRGLR